MKIGNWKLPAKGWSAYGGKIIRIAHWCFATLPRKIISSLVIFSILFSSFYFLFLTPQVAQASWWDSDWLYRKKLTIDETKIDSDLTNFPVLVKLTSTQLDFTKAQSAGQDIRFTDYNGNLLKYEIEDWDQATSTADIWVKIPSVTASRDTNFYMYYGNSSALDSQDKTNVWDTNTKGVWHMNTTSWLDSTANANNGTGYGNVTTTTSGKIGVAATADGNADYVNLGDHNVAENLSSITVSAWVKSANSTIPSGEYQQIIEQYDSNAGTDVFRMSWGNSGGNHRYTFYAYNQLGSSDYSYSAIYTGTSWVYVVGVYNGTSVLIYINGTLDTSRSGSLSRNTASTSNNNLNISDDESTHSWNGNIDDVRISNTARSAAWIKADYNSGNNTLLSFGLQETGVGASLWFKFDEGYGTTAYDSSYQASGTGNNGAISGATWTTSGCKYGKCLDFDGSDDYVTATQSASINLTDKTGYTVSTWIYPHNDGEGDVGQVISKGTNTYLRVNSESSGRVAVSGSLDLATTDATLNIASAIPKNTWSHVEMSYASSQITIYINGILKGTSTDGVGPPSTDTNNILVGGSSGANFNGLIDEVKIYPYTRTASQIKNDYTRGAEAKIGVDESWLTDGLVGYWKMDEASWSGAGAVIDSSGQGNNGTATGDATTSTTAKFNRAGTFDGTGDYVNLGDMSVAEGVGQITVSVWSKASIDDPAWRDIVGKAWSTSFMGWLISRDGNGYYRFYAGNAAGAIVNTVSINAYHDTGWHHLMGVYDGTNIRLYIDGIATGTPANLTGNINNRNDPVCFGGAFDGVDCSNSGNFNGQTDDVRIYNRALSSQEVSRLYDWGPGPVGYWKMDEKTGTQTFDSSGNGNTGTITGATWKSSASCKLGNCLDFSASNSVVNAGTLNDQAFTENGSMTISAWTYARSFGGGAAANIVSRGPDEGPTLRLSGDNRLHFYIPGSTTLQVYSANNSQVLNTWQYWVVTWDGSTTAANVKFYLNGVFLTNSSNTDGVSLTDNSASSLRIGNATNGSRSWNGQIDDVKIYNYARTQKQIMEDYVGSTKHVSGSGSIGSSGTNPTSSTAIAYWKFDEGRGNTAYDSSGNGNNLTMSTEDYTLSGKFGRAWNGDGIKYLSKANDNDFNFTATDDFTLSTWFKSDSADNPASNEFIINKETSSAGYAIYLDTGGDVIFGIDDDTTWTPDDKAGDVGRDFYDNTWHNAIAVKRGPSQIDMFVDGVLIGSDASIAAVNTLTNTAVLYVGAQDNTNNGNEFNGDIDETKIYRYALSAEEVLIEYNRGSAIRVGGSSQTTGVYCPPGYTGTCTAPVGEWKLDEYAGSTAYDTSASTNDGTITGATWKKDIACKSGSCLNFDGNDCVNLGDSNAVKGIGAFAVSVWVKGNIPNPNYEDIIAQYGPATFVFRLEWENTNDIIFQVYNGASWGNAEYIDGIIDANWHHVIGVYDGTNTKVYVDGIVGGTVGNLTGDTNTANATSLYIGCEYGAVWFWKGLIDDVKIFNYALTQEQIAWLYNQGDPVGHWKMDEGQGTTIKDSSKNNNIGAISGATWSTSGKYYSALTFDGTDDVVTATQGASINLTSKLSYGVSAWIYPHTDGEGDTGQIISKGTNNYLRVSGESGGRVAVDGSLDLGTTDATLSIASAIPINTWSHVEMTYADDADDEISIYINGVLAGTSTNGVGSPATDTNNLLIGGSTGANFDGLIDEVKIFNYEPTTEQIKQDYNQGASLRFGP